MHRVCLGCGLEKKLTDFGRDRTQRTGYKARCKSCLAIARRKFREQNRERYLLVQRKYRKSEKYKEVRRRYGQSDKGRAKRNEYRRTSLKHIETRHKYRQGESYKRYRNEYLHRPHVKLRETIRNRLRSALHGNYRKGMGVDNLGCSIQEFKEYLETLFIEGMSWENHGDWHIDHIVPLSSFDLKDDEQVKIACNYKNMRPLWKYDNLSKGNKHEDYY